MKATNKPVRKGAGRPKADPKALLMRRIGKHFYASELLHSAHRKSETSIRESGRGKQPFNNLIKSLQETISMYHEYFALMTLSAKQAGYDIDLAYSTVESDMQKAWAKLKLSYRSDNDMALTDEHEATVFEKIASGSRDKYDAHYPFLDWNEFWFKAEIKALERTTDNAIKSFASIDVEIKTLNEVLSSSEAIKGRKTFKNKQHKNEQSELLVDHSRLIRFNTRLRNLVSSVDESIEDILSGRISFSQDKEHSVKIKSIISLQKKIIEMTMSLNQKVQKSSLPEQYAFKIAMLKKDKLPLTRKASKQALTQEEDQTIADLNKEIESYQSKIKAIQDET